jgi:hypothetical protein
MAVSDMMAIEVDTCSEEVSLVLFQRSSAEYQELLN